MNTQSDMPGDHATEDDAHAALSAALSIHYITMAFYTLGILVGFAMFLPSLIGGEIENLFATLAVFLLPVILFTLHFLAAKGLRQKQQWGYKASRWLGFALLLGFPFGTVLGLFLLSQLAKFRFDS